MLVILIINIVSELLGDRLFFVKVRVEHFFHLLVGFVKSTSDMIDSVDLVGQKVSHALLLEINGGLIILVTLVILDAWLFHVVC